MIQLSDRNSKSTSAASEAFYKGIMTARWVPAVGFDKRVSTVVWTIDGSPLKSVTNEPVKYNSEITWVQNATGSMTIQCVVTFYDNSTKTETLAFTVINPPA